jgi:hypothetical protein
MTLTLRVIATLATIGGVFFGIADMKDSATQGIGLMVILGSLGFGAFQWVVADMADRLESIDRHIKAMRDDERG